MIGTSWFKNRKLLIKFYQTLLNISLLLLSLILYIGITATIRFIIIQQKTPS